MLELLATIAGILGGVAIIISFIRWLRTPRIELVDCYDVGLFASSILWFASNPESNDYKIIKKQFKSALRNLHISISIVESLTHCSKASAGTGLILHVRDGMKSFHEKIGKKIQAKYGKKPYYCCQLGVHLGNLVYCTKFLSDTFLPGPIGKATSEEILDVIENYTRPLQEFCEALGGVKPIYSFLLEYDVLKKTIVTGSELTRVYTQGGLVFSTGRAWIDGNVEL